VPYLLVSLGGILGDILGGILIFLVVFLVTATATAAVEYCSCSVALGLSVW
jgi:nitrate/nitrite transporter NarK